MAKKKKNRDSYWGDLSDQQKAADEFYDYEKTGKPIPEEEKVNDNIFEDGLENLIQSDLLRNVQVEDDREYVDDDGNKQIDVSDYLEQIENGELDDEITTAVTVNETPNEFTHRVARDTNAPDSVLPLINHRDVTFRVMPDIDRFIIDDGIAPTSFVRNELTEANFEYEFDNESTDDAEEAIDYVSDVMEYITTLKHPTAIYSHSEFLEKFADVKSYSEVQYMLLSDNDYVYAYIVDAESVSKLHAYIESETDGLNEEVEFYTALALAAGRNDQVFLLEDRNYVLKFKASSYNQSVSFEKMLKNDPQTALETDDAPITDVGVLFGILSVKDISEIQSSVRRQIMEYTGREVLEEEYDVEISDDGDNTKFLEAAQNKFSAGYEDTGKSNEDELDSEEIHEQLAEAEKKLEEIANADTQELIRAIVYDSQEEADKKEAKEMTALDKVMNEIEEEDEILDDVFDEDESFEAVDVDNKDDGTTGKHMPEPKPEQKKEDKPQSNGSLEIPVIRKKRK